MEFCFPTLTWVRCGQIVGVYVPRPGCRLGGGALPTHGAADGVPMGTPVPHDLPHVGSFPISEEEAKLSRMRLKAKVLNVTSGALLSVVSAPTVYYGADSSCNGMLVRTIFLWSFIFGLLLIAAELELHIVTTHVHAYRSGRALLMIFVGSVTLAAGPSEIPISFAAPGVLDPGKATVLISMHWQFIGVGLILLIAATYTLRLSARAKLHKLQQTRSRAATDDRALL